MPLIHWPMLIGGVAFFFFGLNQVRNGLQAVAGDRLRVTLGRLTGNPFTAFLFGIAVTVMLQSSSATSVMLVSFVQTGLMGLAEAIVVMLGADLGTTFTVFLLSIEKITDYALLLVALGMCWQGMFKRRLQQNIGSIILGFGIIFYSMQLMVQAAEPLKESAFAAQVFGFLAGYPLPTMIFAALLAGFFRSAAIIGIAMALGFAGTLTFDGALPIVLGANVGTCVTVLMSGMGGRRGRQVAIANIAIKLVGVVLVFLFLNSFSQSIVWSSAWIAARVPMLTPGVPGQIVMAHVLFNLILALLFLPWSGLIAKYIQRWFPDTKDAERTFKPKYLDQAALETPSMAFAQVKLEILRIAEIVEMQLRDCLRMFSRGLNVDEEIERVSTEDDKVDLLEKSIRFYLAQLSGTMVSDEQARAQMSLLGIAHDFEEIGDIVSREMVHLARKKASAGRLFSDDGWRDLRKFQGMVVENCELAVSTLVHPSDDIVARLRRHEQRMNEIEQELRAEHLKRLRDGLRESLDTSTIHLDVLSNLRRVNAKLAHIVDCAEELRRFSGGNGNG